MSTQLFSGCPAERRTIAAECDCRAANDDGRLCGSVEQRNREPTGRQRKCAQASAKISSERRHPTSPGTTPERLAVAKSGDLAYDYGYIDFAWEDAGSGAMRHLKRGRFLRQTGSLETEPVPWPALSLT